MVTLIFPMHSNIPLLSIPSLFPTLHLLGKRHVQAHNQGQKPPHRYFSLVGSTVCLQVGRLL